MTGVMIGNIVARCGASASLTSSEGAPQSSERP
jgi:hypothetical protein